MTDIVTPHTIARVDQAHSRLDAHDQRLARLETSEQVSAERQKHIERSLNSIEANQSKTVWLILGSLVAAIMGFILSGGLNVH